MWFVRNTAALFALLGAGIATFLLLPVFGSYWVYLPGVLLSLFASLFVSSKLGALARSRVHGLLGCISAGVGVAVATLIAGVVAFGTVGIFLAWLEDVAPIRTGGGPFSSLPNAAKDFILKPLIWAFLLGGWIAVVLGVAYGACLYASRRSQQ